MGQKRDGHSFVTGFLVLKIDRGDYYLVKTEGAYCYMLYKDREYKGEENVRPMQPRRKG
jgi:hypothetical protein